MLYIIGIALTFFLSFILITKKGKSIADKILFVWLSVILIHLTMFVIISSNEYIRFPYLLGLELPIPLVHGPFLFLYTAALTNKKSIATKRLFHFVPYAVALLSVIPFLILSPEKKIIVYQNDGEGYFFQTTIIFFGVILSGITYCILSLRLLLNHKRTIKDSYSDIEKINLQWLLFLIIGLSLIWIVVMFANDEYIFSCVIIYVMLIGYFGIKQVGVFTNQPAIGQILPSGSSSHPEATSGSIETQKYDKSSLNDNQLEAIHVDLIQLIKQKKIHLTPELTLSMISQELGVHPNTLSQVINRVEQKNFFDYINTLRINEFKERVKNPENQKYTLLAIAYECGFNSKTSFNRNFRNITGQSPTEYLKEIEVSLK